MDIPLIVFFFLAAVNNAAVNIHMYTFVWTCVFISPDTPKGRIGSSYGDSVCNPLVHVCMLSSFSRCSSLQLCKALQSSTDCSLCPWDFPGKKTGVGCHASSLIHWRTTKLFLDDYTMLHFHQQYMRILPSHPC